MSVYFVYLIHQHAKLGKPETDQERAEKGRQPRRPGSKYQSGHYIGKAKDLQARLQQHRDSRGSYYMGAVNRAGITWCAALKWEFSTWAEAGEFERKLKRLKNAPRLCPYCNPDGWKNLLVNKGAKKP